MASEPRAVRSGETTSASPPSRITEPQKTESPHQRVFSKFLGSSREVEVPEVSSSSGRPESGRSRVASRRSSSGRSPSRLPISPTAKVSAEPSRSARGTQDSRGAEGPVEEREEGPRSGSDTVGERLGIESSGSQDVEERPAERSPLASRMSSKHPSRTPSASASRATSPDSSRLTSARSSGRLAVSPTMIPTAGVATLDRKMSLTESSADVTGFVSALPSASMMSEDARAVRQANLWALLNRAEANAATAAASLSLVRERLSEELSTGTGSERTLNGSPETTRIGKSGVGRGSGKKGSSARMSAEVVKVRRVDEGVARASSAPVPLAEFRFVGGLEDEDMVRIGEPGTVELSSEFSGSSMGVSGLAEREDRAGVNRRSPGERERDVRKRMKKLSLRTHPLEKSETVESERLQSGFKEAVGDEVARNEAGTERKTERSAFEPSAATMGSLLASQQGREESDVPSTKAGAGKSLDLARLSLESPTGSIFRVRDALKSASSPVETRNPSGAEVPRLSLPGGFTSPASASPQTGRSSARGTGPKSYRSRANRVLSTERSVEARKSLEAQFRLLEEQKAESDRKRNEGSEVRKSLDERRAALVRRSQEGVAGFAGWLRGTSARANEGLATGSVGSGTGDGSILRVLTERLSRSTGGSEGDVAEALGDVGGVLTSEPAELAEGGVKGRVELIESELPGGLNAADGHDVSRAVSEARSAEALKESGMVPDKRRPAELPRGTPDVADLGLKVRAPAESLPKPSAREPSSVDSLKLSVEYARLFIDPLAASPELQTDPGNLKSSSESVSRSADALLSGSVERVERSERKEIDWGSLDSDSPVRRTEFPSDSESSGPLGGTFRAERNTLPEKKAVDWGTLLTGVGLDVSSDVSRLDDSIESRGEAEPTAAKAVQNQEGLGEQQGSSLWGDEGHVSKWDRRWSPESMHADVMHPEVDENEGRGGADKLFSKEDLENGKNTP